MNNTRFYLGSREDDSDIKKCLRDNPIPGTISLSFETEPSYYMALDVQGKNNKTVICRTHDGEFVGFGSIAIKPVYINGQLCDIGYLSGLRGYQKFRGRNFLSRGYKFFKEVEDGTHVPFYLTTIIEDNLIARKILESGRGALPKYNFLGTLSTFLIKPVIIKSKKNMEIFTGKDIPLEEILSFMEKEGSKKQFYPFLKKEDFGSEYLRGLSQNDFYVAVDGSKILGVVGKWNQESFKQTRVVKYENKLRFARPFINLSSRFTNIPKLPPEGDLLHFFYASFPLTKDNNPKIMDYLLSAIRTDENNQSYDYFVIGFMDNDRLAESAKSFKPREYRSRVYFITFDDVKTDLNFLNTRVPHLEPGTL
jgi:hypothetical protein